MIVTALSDPHGNLIDITPCDLLLIAGDICPVRDHSLPNQREFLDGPFRRWLEEIPARHVVGIAGNHDFIFELAPGRIPTGLRWNYLQDESTTVEGLSIYGTPWQPWFHDWAFNLQEPELAKKWEKIPLGTDVLVVHGPPRGYGDLAVDGRSTGSPSLLEAIRRIKPRLTVFGHIHEGRGQWEIQVDDQTLLLANATLLDLRYRLVYPPLHFQM